MDVVQPLEAFTSVPKNIINLFKFPYSVAFTDIYSSSRKRSWHDEFSKKYINVYIPLKMFHFKNTPELTKKENLHCAFAWSENTAHGYASCRLTQTMGEGTLQSLYLHTNQIKSMIWLYLNIKQCGCRSDLLGLFCVWMYEFFSRMRSHQMHPKGVFVGFFWFSACLLLNLGDEVKLYNCNFIQHKQCQELQDLFVSLIQGDIIDCSAYDSEICFFSVLAESALKWPLDCSGKTVFISFLMSSIFFFTSNPFSVCGK